MSQITTPTPPKKGRWPLWLKLLVGSIALFLVLVTIVVGFVGYVLVTHRDEVISGSIQEANRQVDALPPENETLPAMFNDCRDNWEIHVKNTGQHYSIKIYRSRRTFDLRVTTQLEPNPGDSILDNRLQMFKLYERYGMLIVNDQHREDAKKYKEALRRFEASGLPESLSPRGKSTPFEKIEEPFDKDMFASPCLSGTAP
jgi:hypothetical protein